MYLKESSRLVGWSLMRAWKVKSVSRAFSKSKFSSGGSYVFVGLLTAVVGSFGSYCSEMAGLTGFWELSVYLE